MPATICLINKVTGSLTPIRPKTPQSFKSGTISRGRLLKFKSVGQDCYGLYYPPSHSEYKGPEGALPPAILTVHGGPTGMADRGLKLATQFWTNRGYAVFDVDYSGSTGYGRAYRERLNGGWGQRDVEDLIAAAEYLVKEQLCDPDKLIIQGGSAGGYTCLMALVESDLFKCASVNYPVTDLSQLLAITHKFELGYTYSLTGTTKETAKEELAGRSVFKRASEITAPVIFFQGSEDKVVPPSQPKTLYEALLSKGLVAELYEFEGEGHGFRKAETIIKKLQEEQRFFETCLHLNG
jgi:dipeptidyl aminopeptidase/acylaminoacyl peptidase